MSLKEWQILKGGRDIRDCPVPYPRFPDGEGGSETWRKRLISSDAGSDRTALVPAQASAH